MAKIKSVYICSECGYESPKWYGKCPSCGEWNTMNEEIKDTSKSAPVAKTRSFSSYSKPASINEISTDDEHRYDTGCKELNRVLGGGIVKGSLILLGGDPGIGKSTVLMQICQFMGDTLKILYISGEESKRQLKLRAIRLGVDSPNLLVMTETDVEIICEQIKNVKPDLVMVDSIQTMNLTELNSSPGSVTQVRECTNMLMRTAKGLDIPMFVVGHVNKEGSIAGPKVLEHIVDTVLHFEGDKQMSCRILRAVKNRYGSTNEIGVFEMTDKGLQEVENPSVMLLSGRPANAPGTCVVAVMEGTRPVLAEIQALVTPAGYSGARRNSNGVDYNRAMLLMAVLEKRGGLVLSGCDSYINVVGGLRLDETAADLAVILALASSFKDLPLGSDLAAVGEIGLSGEVRSVTHLNQRLSEIARLGFKRCIIPAHVRDDVQTFEGLETIPVKNIREAMRAVFG